MITTNGKVAFGRFLAGSAPSFASTISLGVGTTAVTLADTRLAYEAARIPIAAVNYDQINNRWVFRGSILPGTINTIYEIGLYSLDTEPSDRDIDTSLFTWTNATLSPTNARNAAQALKIDYVTNGTTNAEAVGLVEDYSMFRGTDSIAVGFYATANLSSLRLRMGTDASNYFELVISSPTNGAYNIYRANKSTFTTVGSPSWNAISYMAIRPSATASGAGSIYFDGFRLDSNVPTSNVLVARTVLTTPYVVGAGINNDVEYSLAVSVT